MLLIYVPDITERIKYTFDLCFNNIVKIDYYITDNINFYNNFDYPKFWYCKNKVDSSFGIFSEGLLFQSEFPINTNQTTNDIFEFTFIIVTQSYHYTNSVYIADFDVTKPIINIIINDFVSKLTEIYPNLEVQKPKFQFIPTVDIDIAFKYKYKNFFRTIGWFVKDIFNFNFSEFKERFLTIINLKPDVWNCFEKIIEIHKNYNLKPIFFFLVGKRGKFDKNVSIKKQAMQNIIKNIAKHNYEIGLHNSVAGIDNFALWEDEKRILEKIIGKQITKSRQHFIKLKFPQTFQNYLKLGLTDDFSLIYPNAPGFRFGVTVPIKFFDFKKNQTTDLRLYPSVLMDVSLKNHKKFTIEKAKDFCEEIINYYKKYGGTFVTIWHNESLSNDKNWKDWQSVYRYILERVIEFGSR